ncbi:MAG: hypothetical protein HQL77_17600, partial [Magnetococcales bacterium]|nr:hypothetical protein [Magnetococcales bacterium]
MTAANISEFENKSLEKLVSFSADLDILIRKKRKQEAKQVRAKMDELAKAAGFDCPDRGTVASGCDVGRWDDKNRR